MNGKNYFIPTSTRCSDETVGALVAAFAYAYSYCSPGTTMKNCATGRCERAHKHGVR